MLPGPSHATHVGAGSVLMVSVMAIRYAARLIRSAHDDWRRGASRSIEVIDKNPAFNGAVRIFQASPSRATECYFTLAF